MHVFTYGSLMFPEVWSVVVGREFQTFEGRASGYAIYRVRDAAFPGIVAAGTESIVRGLVYLEVDNESIARLDRFEDDFYDRLEITVDCADGKARQAGAYVVPPKNRHMMTTMPWTAEWFVSSGGLADFIARFQGFSRLGGAG
ncbi:MAG TPA: gamma-glutamylcyclotransferase family protein [Lacipirellulaceae bacterium]|nr:gamma-glutamylcyclotransferase family protein [Lacipirellulaceae bacterium]